MKKKLGLISFVVAMVFMPLFAFAADNEQSSDTQTLKNKVDQQQAVIDDLKARLDSLEKKSAPAAAPVQPVTAKKAEKGELTGVAYLFYDYHKISSGTTTSQSTATKDAFKLDRAYLSYSAKTGPNTKYNFTTDVRTSVEGTGSKFDLFVKTANFEKTNVFGKDTSVLFGMQGTAWIGNEEAAWKYRSVKKTAADLNAIFPSADFGIGVKRLFTRGDYQLLVSNGASTGYEKSEVDHKKDIQARISVQTSKSMPRASFFYSKGGDAGLRYDSIGLLLNHQDGRFSYGASFLTNKMNATPKGTLISQRLFSIYFNYDLYKSPWSVFGRYDNYDPNRSVKMDRKTLTMFGGAYKIDKNSRAIFSDEYNVEQKSAPSLPNKDKALRATIEVGF